MLLPIDGTVIKLKQRCENLTWYFLELSEPSNKHQHWPMINEGFLFVVNAFLNQHLYWKCLASSSTLLVPEVIAERSVCCKKLLQCKMKEAVEL